MPDDIDEEATADKAAIREWMMRPKRRKTKTNDQEPNEQAKPEGGRP
jgi:hypothetical protein